MDDPNVHALLFADRVIVEEGSRKKGLIGVFTQFSFPVFPATPAPWFVYVMMDNVSPGKHEFSISLTHSSGLTAFSIGGEFEGSEQTTAAELILPVAMQFPKEGRYVFRLFVDERGIADRILNVLRIGKEGG